jgi:aminopeptidase N
MRKTLPIVLALVATVSACKPRETDPTQVPPSVAAAPVLTGPDAKDIHSYADPAVARVTHVALDLTANFETRTMQGAATLDVLAQGANPELSLDTSRLAIQSVRDDKGRDLPFTLAAADPLLGSALRIKLGVARRVTVAYSSSPEAEALQWLSAAQTAGGKQPYLFSQGQAILTRTWLPTQDSPGIRQTWEAVIRAPAALAVVMSAERMAEPRDVGGGLREWRYRMEHPVAPYLIALGIGELGFQSLGPRTGVYTEPSKLSAAANELVDLEKMVAAAESIYGPYRWGRYDLLVLPPSFPFGGMENPRLTFATPTIIAGDRSLVSLVAHELAHSWSGNLVTNATWADFWLNEGFTDYFENRIMEAVYGKETADMLADLRWDELNNTLREMGGNTALDSRLHLDLAGRNPDDAMTDIAYVKGSTFLRTIEAAVGRERWDTYLKDYFNRLAFQPQTSARFLADLREHLVKGDAALEQQLKLDEWVYQPGLPTNAVHVSSRLLSAIDARAGTFIAKGISAVEVQSWNYSQRVRFLQRLPRTLSAAQLASLVQVFELDSQRNSEVRFAWLRVAIANRYQPAVANLTDFLTSMGRRKFVLPLFTDLVGAGGWGRALAQSIYATARPGYHSVTAGSVDKVVKLDATKGH